MLLLLYTILIAFVVAAAVPPVLIASRTYKALLPTVGKTPAALLSAALGVLLFVFCMTALAIVF